MDTGLLSDVFTLPSGVEAEIREMSGREEDLFANEQIIKSGKIGHRILGAVVLKLDGQKPSSQDIQEMWSADRTAAMLHTRVLTFGETLQGEAECSNSDCDAGIAITVDHLIDDLEYTERPEEIERTIELPGGLTARIRPGKGVDEEKLMQAQRKGEFITEMLFTRTLEVEGIESRQALRRFLADGSLRVRRALRDEISKIDFGYDTALSVTCPACGTEQNVDVQGLTGFFFPETDTR